jgi:predicted alpha/beta-hydrolase family hydrolase
MNIVCLPGKNKESEKEMLSIYQSLEAAGHRVEFIRWKHWDADGEFDPAGESGRIEEVVAGFGDESYCIVAKSSGIFAAATLLSEKPDYRQRLIRFVLLGVPLKGSASSELVMLRAVLRDLQRSSVVIQNKQDPYGGEDEIKKILQGIDLKMVFKKGNDHNYNNTDEIARLVMRIPG